jgi:hypothetical protein
VDDIDRDNLAHELSVVVDKYRLTPGVEIDDARCGRVVYAFREMLTKIESGQEAKLLVNIVFYLGICTGFGVSGADPYSEKRIGHIYSQGRIDSPGGRGPPYSADILIVCTFWDRFDPLHVVVECDGPWHEKEKQYHADRFRDRWMQRQNYRVLRFTTKELARREGYQICVREVLELIAHHLERERDEFKTSARMRRMVSAIRGSL